MCGYVAHLFVAVQFLRRIYDWWYLHSFLTHRVLQASFFFASEPFIGVHRELSHIVDFLADLSFDRFLVFDTIGCYFCGFLWCNERWLFCISFILTSDFSGLNVL